MAQEKYSFFNSATGDVRSYDADAMASAMRALALSGVSSLDDGLKITAEGSTMRTLAEPGMAVLRGYFYELRDDGGEVMTFTHAATSVSDRIDRIVLRLDLTERTISMVKKDGTAASTPVPPTLTRSDTVFEISLAQVRVRAGNTAVLAADVLDERPDESVCGAALPEGVKLSTLWERMPKETVTTDAAGLMSTTDKGRLDGLHAAITPDATDNELDMNGYKLVNTDIAFDGETEAGEGGTVRGALKAARGDIGEIEEALPEKADLNENGKVLAQQASSSIEQITNNATWTITAADAGKLFLVENGCKFIIPYGTPPQGNMELEVCQMGEAAVKFEAQEGITLLSPGGCLKTGEQYASVTLKQIGQFKWLLQGMLDL